MDNCSNLLAFDTTEIKSNFSSKLSFLQYVNAQNYEENKQRFSVAVPEYFSAGFEEFVQKRSELTQLVIESQVVNLSQSYYQHALSPTGAKAYASCVAETNRKLIAAWVEFSTNSQIVVVIRTGVGGHESITTTFSRVQPKERIVKLTAGGSKAYTFDYDPKKDFSLVINATSDTTGAQDQTSIEVPRVRSMRIVEDFVDVPAFITAGAGGNGNTSANPIWTDGAFVAPAGGYYLLPETMVEVPPRVSVFSDGAGLGQFVLQQTPTKVNGKVHRIDLHPTAIDGTSGDTQSQVRVSYTIRAMRQRVVEDI